MSRRILSTGQEGPENAAVDAPGRIGAPWGGHRLAQVREPWARGVRSYLFLALLAWPTFAQIPPAIEDPTETVGPQKCAECHDAEHRVWLGTAHAELYDSDEPLHERSRAQEIARNLGERLIKHDSLCLQCHFTPTVRGSRVTAVAGVSCESCHGAADDWVNEHNTWQGRQVSRATEDAATTRARRARAAELGMRSPGDMYALLGACYRCHMVPDERLVQEGGHTSGGAFDPVERVDRIKHTFVTAGSREKAAELTDARKRQLYVLGQALELEMRLRLVAEADDAGYARRRAGPLRNVIRNLERIRRTVDLPDVEAMLGAAKGLSLEAGNADELSHAADKVAQAAESFARGHDGSRLAELDPLLGGGSLEVAEAVAADNPLARIAAGRGEPDSAFEGSPETREAEGSGTSEPAADDAPARPRVEGDVQKVIRSKLTEREIVGQGQCSGCHAEQNDWWYGDPHQASMQRFESRTRKAVQIASNYYGTGSVAEYLTTSSSVCMGCHGTVVSGTTWSDSGVSCEQCHGPAGDYVKTHKDLSRAQRLQLGMVDLEDLNRRAEVCASCHYVTDPRLISSGHPTGRDFDPAERLRKIEHWKGGQPGGSWPSAYAQVRSRRGPIPDVRVASLESGGGGDAGGAPAPGGAPARRPRDFSSRGGLQPPPQRPVDPSALTELTDSGRTVDLPPWPEAEGLEDQPAEEILRQVQRRLETLYESIRESGR